VIIVFTIFDDKYDWIILIISAIVITFQESILNIELGYIQTFIFGGVFGMTLYGIKTLIKNFVK